MMKKLLKSVHIYRSYRQNKPGGPFFGPHGIYITCKELFGVVCGLKKYRQHLLGWSIIVCTNHAALTYLMKMSEPIGQLGRWMDLLSEYDNAIQHQSGRVHSNSNALSQRPCERNGDTDCQQCSRATQDLLQHWFLVPQPGWTNSRCHKVFDAARLQTHNLTTLQTRHDWDCQTCICSSR